MTIVIVINFLLALITSLVLAINPVIIAATILLIALIIATIYAILLSSWYAIVIFLIYVGGILVIFAYFTSLVPNQSLILITDPIIIIAAGISLSAISIWLEIGPPLFTFSSDQLRVFYSSKNFPILILLTLYLLLTIVIVVKVSITSKGPIRAFISYV